MSDTEMYENPLVPNEKLQQMYVAMAEARALDEHIARLQKRAKGKKGRLRLEYASFQANDDPAPKLVMYTVA